MLVRVDPASVVCLHRLGHVNLISQGIDSFYGYLNSASVIVAIIVAVLETAACLLP